MPVAPEHLAGQGTAVADPRPSQVRVAATFALRMSASHALALYLAWLSFTKGSAALAGVVLALKAGTGLLVPLLVGRAHDRGSLRPWLRVAALLEAVAAVALVAVRSAETTNSAAAAGLALILGATAALFDTAVYPLVLAGKPGRLRAHVVVGLSFDLAKIAGSSVVLALLAGWSSPVPVMLVAGLSLFGWRLAAPVSRDEGRRNQRDENQPADGASLWNTPRVAAVAAACLVSLLPGQLLAYQTALAHGSFRTFALLGTVFAVGAVVGNVVLQRTAVSAATVALGYCIGAGALAAALAVPMVGMAAYGFAAAFHVQLTRALVVGSAPALLQGRASGVTTAVTKVFAVFGALIAGWLMQRSNVLIVGGAGVYALAALLLMGVAARSSMTSRSSMTP
jgi:hypothetical protein